MDYTVIKEFVGKTIGSVEINKDRDEIIFVFTNGENYLMYHEQDCCESVYIEDIEGNLLDLVGSPLLLAEEANSIDPLPGQEVSVYDDSFTWTFYRFATVKGYVTLRWFGRSNGYYSESVKIKKL